MGDWWPEYTSPNAGVIATRQFMKACTASVFCVYFCFQIQLTTHWWCILIFVAFFWLAFSSFSFQSMCVLDELPSFGSEAERKYVCTLELVEPWCP